MQRRVRSILAGVSLVVLAACMDPVVSLRPAARTYTPRDYPRVYERWTRDSDKFDFGALRTVLHVTATFESRDFRWAYVVRYSDDFSLPPDARTSLLAASLQDAEKHHRFFVTLGDGRPRDVDLSDANGAWRVILMDDRGRQTRPVEVQRLRRATAAERSYFPTISSFRRAFRLVFPVAHEDGSPTLPLNSLFAVLRFSGPGGQVDLKWDFDEGRRRKP